MYRLSIYYCVFTLDSIMSSKRKRDKGDEGPSSRANKTRTGKKEIPEGISPYVIQLCGGRIPDNVSELKLLTGIPADLGTVDEKTNRQYRALNDTIDHLQTNRKKRQTKTLEELQGTLFTDEKYQKFAGAFRTLHERHGYADMPLETGKDPSACFYTIWKADDFNELSNPSLSTVDPCMLLTDGQRMSILNADVYQAFESLIRPFIDPEAEDFILTTKRKQVLDLSGWMELYNGIDPDQRFACEFYISRVGNWGLYVLLEHEGTPEGQKVVYYMYVCRTDT